MSPMVAFVVICVSSKSCLTAVSTSRASAGKREEGRGSPQAMAPPYLVSSRLDKKTRGLRSRMRSEHDGESSLVFLTGVSIANSTGVHCRSLDLL
ncbi:hypothetical protein EDB89DRAFT_1932600 [Lactarius sanguifluus]|nr:hypothetical protein EDB89DRAFT_1932600 [Lactarius sanguifluus]